MIATTVTGANRFYMFTGLEPDEYYVDFVHPSDYFFSPQGQGTDESIDSYAITLTGLIAPLTISMGETDTSLDAGIFEAIPLIDIKKFTNHIVKR